MTEAMKNESCTTPRLVERESIQILKDPDYYIFNLKRKFDDGTYLEVSKTVYREEQGERKRVQVVVLRPFANGGGKRKGISVSWERDSKGLTVWQEHYKTDSCGEVEGRGKRKTWHYKKRRNTLQAVPA